MTLEEFKGGSTGQGEGGVTKLDGSGRDDSASRVGILRKAG